MADKQYYPHPDASGQFPIPPGTFSPLLNELTQIAPNFPPSCSNMYPELQNWDNFKIPGKIDLVELTSKDFSPSNYYNIEENQFSSQCTQNKFSSCAQASGGEVYKSCAYGNGFFDPQIYSSYPFEYNGDYMKGASFGEQHVFDFPALNDQQESNDGSDIVVEDSSSDCSEDHTFYKNTKCLLCKIDYSPLGQQFYVLTRQNPLTMSSQTPVRNKISEFVGNVFGTDNYLCNVCLGVVNTIDNLQVKIKNMSDSLFANCLKKQKPRFTRYKCKKCKRVVSMDKIMKFHSSKHKLQGFLCHICGKAIKTHKKFLVHVKTHNKPALINAFKCSNHDCAKIFRTQFHRKEHENYCLGLLPFKCKSCSKKFPSATKLKSHIRLKHEKKFHSICSICNIGFVKNSDYKSHMISHSSLKKFPCTKCDKSYKTLSNLNFHLKSHDKTLPFICAICNKGFMRKEYHDAHVNNHKGIKNFACNQCDKKFVSQKNLDAHLKYHDGTFKTRNCNVCKKDITSNFEEHLRVHGNSKEFECDLCELRFNTKNSLSKHKKRKHDIKLGHVA